MLKKILCLALSVCMILTMVTCITVTADTTPDIVATVTTSEEGDGSFKITFASTSSSVESFQVVVPYDKSKYTLLVGANSIATNKIIFNQNIEGSILFSDNDDGAGVSWYTTNGMMLDKNTGETLSANAEGLYEIAYLTFNLNKANLTDDDYLNKLKLEFNAYSFAAPTDKVPTKTFVEFNIPDTRTEIEGLAATAAEGLKYTGTAFDAKTLITVNALETDTVDYTTVPEEVKNAGDYKVTATVKRAGYKPTAVSADVTIGKADTTITIADAEITYGDTEYTKDFTVAEGVDKSEITVSDYTVANLNAGEKEITATATSANYNVTVTPGTLTVNKKAITAKVKDATKVYGEEDPAFEADATGLVGEDTLTYTYNRAEGENVGTYAINATVADANYDVTVVPGTLTVNPKAATIKVQNEFQVLGDGKLATFKTPVVEGLVGEDTIEGIVVDFAAGTPWADVEGDYTLTATYTANPNYTITVVDGVYAIKTAIPVVVTFGENKKTYGDADDAEILATGDLDKVTITRVKGLENAAAGIYEDAYEITLIEEKDEYGVPYAVVDTNNQFVVEPKAATITIANAEKKVEDADPEFTFTDEGFLEGEDPAEITFTRIAGETAGTYAITTAYTDPNYAITVNDGTLIISKYKVKVTAPTVTVFVGRTAPELVATIENENQEEHTATVSVYEEDGVTTVTEVDTSSAKKYVTKAVIEGLDTDKYDFEYVDGTITVRESGGRPSGTGIIKPATGGGGGSGSTTKPEDKDDTAKPAASANIAIKEDAKDVNFAVADAENKFNPDVNASRNDVVAAISAIFDVTDVKNAPAFTDTEDEAIKALAAAGVINGYEDGSFQGEKDITRAEFVKLLAAALKLEAIEGAEANFSDIDGHWASEWIKTFVAKGYLVGYPDGTFRPEAKITRAEMVVVITRVTGAVAGDAAVEFADVDASHWAYDYIMKAAK